MSWGDSVHLFIINLFSIIGPYLAVLGAKAGLLHPGQVASLAQDFIGYSQCKHLNCIVHLFIILPFHRPSKIRPYLYTCYTMSGLESCLFSFKLQNTNGFGIDQQEFIFRNR